MITIGLIKPATTKYKPLHGSSFAEDIFGKYGLLKRDFWSSLSFIYRQNPAMAGGKQTSIYRLFQSILVNNPVLREREIVYFTQSILYEKVINRVHALRDTEKQIFIKPVFMQDSNYSKQVSYIKSFNELKLNQLMSISMAAYEQAYKQVYDITHKPFNIVERENIVTAEVKSTNTLEYVRLREQKTEQGPFGHIEIVGASGFVTELLLSRIVFFNQTTNHFGGLHTDLNTGLEQNRNDLNSVYPNEISSSNNMAGQYFRQYGTNISNTNRIIRKFDAYIENYITGKTIRLLIKKTSEAVSSELLTMIRTSSMRDEREREVRFDNESVREMNLLTLILRENISDIKSESSFVKKSERTFIATRLSELERQLEYEKAKETSLLERLYKNNRNGISEKLQEKENSILEKLYSYTEVPSVMQGSAEILQKHLGASEAGGISQIVNYYGANLSYSSTESIYGYQLNLHAENEHRNILNSFIERSIWSRLIRESMRENRKESSNSSFESRLINTVSDSSLRMLVKLFIESRGRSITNHNEGNNYQPEYLSYIDNYNIENTVMDTTERYLNTDSIIRREGMGAGAEAAIEVSYPILQLDVRRQYSRDMLSRLKQFISNNENRSESKSESSLLRESERRFLETRLSELEGQLEYERAKETSLLERLYDDNRNSISERLREKENSILEKLYSYAEVPSVMQQTAEVLQKHLGTAEMSSAAGIANYYGASSSYSSIGNLYSYQLNSHAGAGRIHVLNDFAERSIWSRLVKESIRENRRESSNSSFESRLINTASNSSLRTLVRMLIENRDSRITDRVEFSSYSEEGNYQSEYLSYTDSYNVENDIIDISKQYINDSNIVGKENIEADGEASIRKPYGALQLEAGRQYGRDILNRLKQFISSSENRSESKSESSLLRESERRFVETRLSEMERQLEYERAKETSLLERLYEDRISSISERLWEKENSILEKLYSYAEVPAAMQGASEVLQKHLGTIAVDGAARIVNYYDTGSSYLDAGNIYNYQLNPGMEVGYSHIFSSFAERSIWSRLIKESIRENRRESSNSSFESKLVNIVPNGSLKALVRLLIANSERSVTDMAEFSRHSEKSNYQSEHLRYIDRYDIENSIAHIETRSQYSRDMLSLLRQFISNRESRSENESSLLRKNEVTFIETRLSELERRLEYERAEETHLNRLYKDIASWTEAGKEMISEGNFFSFTTLNKNLLRQMENNTLRQDTGSFLSNITSFSGERLAFYNTKQALTDIDMLSTGENHTTIRGKATAEELVLKELDLVQAVIKNSIAENGDTTLYNSPVRLEHHKDNQQNREAQDASYPEAGAAGSGKERGIFENAAEENVRIPEDEMLRIVDRVYEEIERKLRTERHSRGIY